MASLVRCIIPLGMLCFGIAAENFVISPVESLSSCTTASGERGYCVYQYQCFEGTISTSGENIMDIRQALDDCHDPLLECCAEPSTSPTDDSNEATNATFTPVSGEEDTKNVAVPGPSFPTTPRSTSGSHRPAINIPPYDLEGCGHRNPNGVIFTIENNQFSESEYGEYPWTVAIFARQKDHSLRYLCGGALIERAAVLTTANCLFPYRFDVSSLVVRMGEWDMSTTREPIPHVDSEMEKIHLHPHYGMTSKINDIAIVILRDTIDLNHTIGLVCLPPANDIPHGAELVGVGWGDVPNFVEPPKLPRTILKKAHLRHLHHDLCQKTLHKLMGRRYLLHDSFLCAEAQSPEMLPCRGDTGSPYVKEIENGNDRYYLMGLSSWGYDCNMQRMPTVLTNVAYHRNWIDDVIKSEHLSTWSYTYELSIPNDEE